MRSRFGRANAAGRGRVVAGALGAALLAGACAQETAPVGGPPDPLPPVVVRISPAPGATGVRPDEVEFRFDEVISERVVGAQSLDELVLISPRDGDPRVRWRRDALTVRPRQGWRPNTTYRVTLQPGVQDLRSNPIDSATVVVFSTGGEIIDTRLRGVVFDWAAGRPIPEALVYGISRPADGDSVLYVTRADVQGRFELPHVPPGPVTVLALQDANDNFGIDPRELWDSTRVTLDDSARVELYAFAQDTIGPIVQQVALVDSLTLSLTLDQPLSVTAPLVPTQISVLGPDSQPVPITAVLTRTAFDSAARPALPDSAVVDSAAVDTAAVPPPVVPPRGTPPRGVPRAGVDTTLGPPPVPSRPIPAREIVVRLGRPLVPGTRYTVQARALRNLLERPRDSQQTLEVPEPPPPPPAPVPPGDTTGTTPPPPGPR